MNAMTLSAATADVRSVRQLIERHALSVHFQPIVSLADATVFGHEALVRTPPGVAWTNPDALFAAARREGVLIELEIACVRTAIRAWSERGCAGKLFVNLSAAALLLALDQASGQLPHGLIGGRGVAPASVVIELTEHEHVRDVDRLNAATTLLRQQGVGIALDDFGDGRSSLRLWSELKPEIVKIDKYFTHDLSTSGNKLQTFRALLHIAETFGTSLVAEGIETEAELRIVRDLGIRYGQGYALGRPQAATAQAVLPAAHQVLTSDVIAVFPEQRRAGNHGITAARLLREVAPVNAHSTHDEVFALFQGDESLHGLAVAEQGRPLGLLNRQRFISSYAKPYFRELYGRRPALLHANHTPLLLDLHTGIEELTSVLTSSDQRYLTEGFIITEGGRYRGLGTGEQLVRAVTEARIEAARHANPLTFLPGNIPISKHIDRLLASGRSFVACYADLNQFKPFNDHYGYWRGDEMIRLVARVVVSQCDAQRDFVGHVGGDDFVLLFQSGDWAARCEQIVHDFNAMARSLFDADALAAGGITAEDRHGVMRFHPCTTLSIGAVAVMAGRYHCSDDVASAAAAAKRQAKLAGLGVCLLAAPPLDALTA
ncbi:EAL domain-containing protein [Aquabacterium sp.]|uniref:EAL domain-containing protein n=1 Tax=Aquabacterium sp. TaxID=1872578 RepID=UPI002CE1010C|nr:EAL domain-containing protein [Aquabacterium sp.]HSW04098.1 EAL domain-containing protein [Aquabacterium sp.]